MDGSKRWLALARPRPRGWLLTVEPVGDVAALLPRLLQAARGAPVALGVDFPIGLPAAFARRHCSAFSGFPAFLKALSQQSTILQVARSLDEVGPLRPFYPHRGTRGMTRLSHAHALGLEDATSLSRLCDRATAHRPAGAPMFWTLGANQSGKAAIAAWRDLLLPALGRMPPPSLWPFEGAFRSLLRPGQVTVAETYPAEALRQLGLRPIGSKRRRADRLALVPGLRHAMTGLRACPDPALDALLLDGFGADAAGEDRLDCLLGVLCVLLVIEGRRPDAAPDDATILEWEGWVLGQDPP